jgi:hypothetical protein
MPRRYWDYDAQYTIFHQLSTIGAFVLGISMFTVVVYLMASWKTGKRAPRNPWGGSSLEWQAPTPPPLYNFEKPPVIHELYNYDDLVEVEEDVWERRAPVDADPSEVPGDAHAHAKGAAEPPTATKPVPAKAEEVDNPEEPTEHPRVTATSEDETKPERVPGSEDLETKPGRPVATAVEPPDEKKEGDK